MAHIATQVGRLPGDTIYLELSSLRPEHIMLSTAGGGLNICFFALSLDDIQKIAEDIFINLRTLPKSPNSEEEVSHANENSLAA